MRRVLILGLMLVLLTGCAQSPLTRRYELNASPLETDLKAAFEQCEQVAERVDLASTLPSTLLAEERPDYGFPNQVLSPDELTEGGIYVWCSMLAGYAVAITLTSDPYVMEDIHGIEELWVDGIFLEDFGTGDIRHWTLSRMGVVPYTSGMWNEVSVILYP